jgi:hypothetical protein
MLGAKFARVEPGKEVEILIHGLLRVFVRRVRVAEQQEREEEKKKTRILSLPLFSRKF